MELAKRHYRCCTVFLPETAIVITDILQFLTHKIPFPMTTVGEHMKFVIDKIVTLISSKVLTMTPTQDQHKQIQLQDAFIQVSWLLNNNQSDNSHRNNTI